MSTRFAGRYRLLRPLGRGGMGEVFLALDLATGATCALKRFAPRMARDAPDLRREFDALTRVRHPAVVAVHELGFAPDGAPFYTMEYVAGRPADAALARGDWAALAFVGAEVAHALQALHAAGVVHGDLKPSNLLVIPGPEAGAVPAAVRLLDFGLAAVLGAEAGGHRGTPGYAAPEVVRGEVATAASDLYGLGATLYAIAAERPPFESEHPTSLLRRQQAGPPPGAPLEEVGAPPALVRLVLRLMAPEVAERPRDAREVRRELERIHPSARRPLEERMAAAVTVGRDRELARIEARAQPGLRRSRVIVLRGGPGIGKSALIEALATRAALAGRSVVRISCAATEGAGGAALALARRFATDAGVDPAAETSLSSSLGTALAGGTPILGDADLEALAGAAARWIRPETGSGEGPLLLLDDADRLDPASRSFLRRLVLHPEAAPTRWVLAGRGDPMEDERTLLQAGYGEILDLGPLPRHGLRQLASARLGEPVHAGLEEHLWRETGGHPGLAIELMREAARSGALREEDAGLVVDPSALREIGVPVSFEASLLARLDAQGEAARHAAAALSIAGGADAARIGTLAPGTDARVLERLREAGLARKDEAGRFRLSPPALAGAILERLDAPSRARLHRAALAGGPLAPVERLAHLRGAGEPAAALEAAAEAFAAAPDAALAEEAAELAEARDPALAAEWLERAARELSARGRYAAAIPHLERALALDPSPVARPTRWVMLSNAVLRAGLPEEAGRTAARALAEPLPAAMRSRILSNEAARLFSAGRTEEALAAGREALALAERERDDEAEGVAAQTMGTLLAGSAPPGEAETLAARAVEAFARFGNVAGELRALAGQAYIEQVRRRPTETEIIYREAITRARDRNLRLPLEELLVISARSMIEFGRWSEARAAAGEATGIALEDGRPRGAAIAIANLAQLDGLTGNRSNALRNARGAVRLARAYLPEREGFAWRSLAQARRIAGRRRAALAAARRALALCAARPEPEEGDWCHVELGRALAAGGRWREAGELWGAALGNRRSDGSVGRIMLLALAGRAALRRGDLDAAATRLEEADRALAAHPVPYAAAMTETLRAEHALARGRVAEGVEAAARALEGFASLPAPPDRAHTALELARLALARDHDPAIPVGPWLEAARALFERLGDHHGREQALALTVEWLRRKPPVAEGSGRERGLIEAVSRLMNSMSDFPGLTRRAMGLAVEQMRAERGVLLLADAETGALQPVAEYGAVDATTRRDAVGYSRRVVQRVAESGGSLLIGDAPADPESRSESVVDLRLRSIVCVPMYLGGRVVGAVYLDDSRRPDVFSDADRAQLEGFAHLMAVAIDNSRGHVEILRGYERLVDENLALRQEVTSRYQPQGLIGTSTAMQRVLAVVERAAQVNVTVLLTGENGTGKELIARILHHGGPRRLKPFVAVNCGAIPESLLESELFGILPHVATDVRGREGRFVQADGGTLFLDEIAEMPLKQQVALLSVISNREITPVGGGKAIPVDVRIIAATNRDLRRLVERREFRDDLFYRLNVIPIELPPLRDRKADIPALARHFVELFARQQEREVPRLSAEFMAALMQSDWQGNVRELQNYIERVLAMTPGDTLHPRPLPLDLEERPGAVRLHGRKLPEMVRDLERKAIAEALERASGNQSLAARNLGMTEQSLRYRIRKYGLDNARNNRRVRRNR